MIGAKGSAYPFDLREAGPVDDPAFDRPLVRGVITPEGGIVEVRRSGSDEVERHEVKLAAAAPQLNTRKETEAMTATAVETKPILDADEKTALVAKLYNDGVVVREIARKVGVNESQAYHYINLAVEKGLITQRRAKKVAATDRQSAPPDVQLVAKVDDIDAKMEAVKRTYEEIKTRLDAILAQPPAPPAPGVAVLEDLSRELEAIKRQNDILAGGLAELSNRVRALEESSAEELVDAVGVGSDLVNRLLRLVELELAATLLEALRHRELGKNEKNGEIGSKNEKTGDRNGAAMRFSLDEDSAILAENGRKSGSAVA